MSDSGRHRSPVAPGDVVGGKYRVERVLGAGGMGVVVAATHVDLGQAVALKFIQTAALASAGSLERFMREARAAARLRSEHVCRVLDVARDGDHPYMVLELLEGMDLAKVAKHHGPLPVADAVEYVLQACDALVEAHGLGIVHRDLKPQNIFVTRRVNGTPLVKVLDFGIAKNVGAAAAGQMALTDSSAIIGSPLYMAPEQMRAPKTVDVRIDIWALGVILYALLGGQLPFDGETVTEVCIKVVNEEPTRLLDLRPALERKLVDVVMRCLEKDPEDRWQNVAQLAVELEPFSRSGKQGSFTRPWRSFEDTTDSKDAVPRVVVSAAGIRSGADETGPSTAITIPSVPGGEVAAALAAINGSSLPNAKTTPLPGAVAQPAASSQPLSLTPSGIAQPRRPSLPDDAPHALASTDTAWGEGTARQPAQAERPARAGRIGAVLAAVAFAAAVVGLYAFQKRAVPVAAHRSDGAPPAAVSVLAPAAEGTVPSSTAVVTPAPEVTSMGSPEPRTRAVASATSTAAVPKTSPPSRPTRANEPASVRPKPAEPPAKPAEASAEPAKPVEPKPVKPAEPKPAETTSPNGAPILH